MAQKQIPHFDGVIDMEMTPEDQLAADEQKIQDEIYSEFLADDKSEWIVTVNKVNPQTKKQQTCFKMSPGELPGLFERLRDEFGPGEYRAYVSKNGKVTRNLGYDIAAPIKKPETQTPSQLSDLGRILERQTEMIANLVRGGNANAPAPADPLAMFTAMMGALGQAKEFFAPAQTQGGSSIKDFMEMLAFAKEIVADGGGGGRNAIDLAAEFFKSPIAGELAEQFRAQRTAPQIAENPRPVAQLTARPVPASPTPGAPAPQAPASPMPEILASLDQATLTQMKQQVDFWVTRAAKDSDPNLYAELFCDTIPLEFVAFFINRPDLMEAITFLNPAAAQYLVWFAELREAINHILTAEGDGDDKDGEAAENPDVFEPIRQPAAVHPNGDSIGAGGGGGDVGDNVAAGKGRKKDASNKGKGGRAN